LFCHKARVLTDGRTGRQLSHGYTVRYITCSRTVKTTWNLASIQLGHYER